MFCPADPCVLSAPKAAGPRCAGMRAGDQSGSIQIFQPAPLGPSSPSTPWIRMTSQEADDKETSLPELTAECRAQLAPGLWVSTEGQSEDICGTQVLLDYGKGQ